MSEQKTKEKQKIVPDTSIIIDGTLSEMIEDGEISDVEIVIPEMVMDELESQANRGMEVGYEGLREIKRLREEAEDKSIDIINTGRRPTEEEIRLAKKGRIDALIRDVAKESSATLYTGDRVQAETAEASGIDVVFVEQPDREEHLLFEDFLEDDVMSLHLKTGSPPRAKKGEPGDIQLVNLGDDPLTEEEVEKYAENIVHVAGQREDGHFEISKKGAEIIQIDQYRIAITKPPFSKNHEITVVRPLVKLSLEDYEPSDKLIRRLREQAEGILVAGPPGSGKTTFVQSLAEFYLRQDEIVKTMESPRDLHVPPEVTQYGPLNNSMQNTSDILLMVRPDYTVYDEVRKSSDFKTFIDMRMAGVGMIGVVHATQPIDAVQRFVGRAELGMVPNVLDTIIYIREGGIAKVYSVDMKVRVPTGMVEQDLARPVVEIRDFETGYLEYEIFTFGEENVVVPIEEEDEDDPLRSLAADRIKEELKEFDRNLEVDFLSDTKVAVYVQDDAIAPLIGKGGSNIEEIERKLGISIDVQPKEETLGNEASYETEETDSHIVFTFEDNMRGENANIYIDDEYLFTATVGKNAQIRLSKDSDLGSEIINAMSSGKDVSVFV